MKTNEIKKDLKLEYFLIAMWCLVILINVPFYKENFTNFFTIIFASTLIGSKIRKIIDLKKELKKMEN